MGQLAPALSLWGGGGWASSEMHPAATPQPVLSLRAETWDPALWGDHTAPVRQREKKGGCFSSDSQTEMDQTVWINFRSNPNSLNNHQAGFLLD